MVLRYFHPISVVTKRSDPTPKKSFVDLSNQPLDAQVGSKISGQKPTLATQDLALEMERARIELLCLLIENPIAYGYLIDQLSDSKGEGACYSFDISDKTVDEEIVQHNDFVKSQSTSNFPLKSKNQIFVGSGSKSVRPEDVHFFPAFLIRIADRTLHTVPNDFTHKVELAASRRHLQDIRQRMIAANTGLVAFLAHKYKTSALSFDDLMQEGIIGLIRAVDRFDPNRGIRFSTYAVFWIKQAISRLIVKQEKVVCLPIAMAEKASVVFEAMRNCYLEHQRWPSLVELQARCELSLEEIKTISSYYQATHSLDESLSGDKDDQTLLSGLIQHQFPQPLDELVDQHLSLYLGKIIASLPEKEAAILTMRFGLKNHTEMTLQAVAEQLHVTRERVRQIQNKALKKLKQNFGYDLMPFLEPNDG
ncbi:sigma-70 family RNA polymerase sigma factor [Methylomonas rapida]|uniref:RNA polymerase sigma factor RpoD/SigA n=1 Tax=Methylomonas rapida TaxID=2963939 RepID=A0ABY7GNL4_9GAMM|nr:RNA polymerase sigma factor RpoD/SigA [Methylomonas rapida]WAR46103.1 RNA polymerase sigma factor RpoD/SigA [Methylomonas rapida]